MDNAPYFSVSALSVDDERVPCTTALEFASLGFLDLASQSQDLPAGSRVELPLWLATLLNSKQVDIEVNLPKHYRQGFRDHLESGPAAVNLREQSPHFFAVGNSLARCGVAQLHLTVRQVENTRLPGHCDSLSCCSMNHLPLKG